MVLKLLFFLFNCFLKSLDENEAKIAWYIGVEIVLYISTQAKTETKAKKMAPMILELAKENLMSSVLLQATHM